MTTRAWLRTAAVAFAALAALGLGGCVGATTESRAPLDQKAPGNWRALAPMPTARQEVAVATLDGLVVVIGGFDATGSPVPTVEAYDPATNRWQPRPPLPQALHHAAAVTVSNRLFVLGGYTGGRLRWTPVDHVWELDRARGGWVARAAMPTARGALAAAVLGGRVHALGGNSGGITAAHEVYDPAANRWFAANAMPTARDHLTAVAFQGRLWAIGGRAAFFGDQYDKVEIYDPATDSWRTGPPLPAGRGGLAAVAFPDRILVFGGEAPFRIFNATEMFEPAGNRWIAKEPMPTARHGIGAVVVGERVYVPAGGTQPGLAASDALEVYTP